MQFVRFTQGLCGILFASTLLAGPQTGITLRTEIDNQQVRVERVTIPAGFASDMHSHTRPSLEVFLTDDHIRETMADGTTREWRAKAREVAWIGAITHRVENLRGAATEIISIEFKTLPPAAARTATSASAAEFENEWIHVTHGKLAPGQKGAVHTHSQYIGVFLTDTKLRAHLADGTQRELTGKSGEVFWREPVTHSVENIAGTSFEAIDVNLKAVPGQRPDAKRKN